MARLVIPPRRGRRRRCCAGEWRRGIPGKGWSCHPWVAGLAADAGEHPVAAGLVPW